MANKKDAAKAEVEASNDSAPSKKSRKTLLAFFLCFVFSVAASVATTYFLMPKDTQVATEEPENNLKQQLSSLQESIASQNQAIQAVKAENDILKLYLRHSSSTALKNILIDQENNIQAYLKVMKAAMEDLTKLTSGTRDWNNKYQYQLDLALKGSLEREDLLKLLKTGEPNEKK
ncbi:hypothetical protein GCM10009112_17800 [Marinomonas arenicola]|uniref:hypothetical protein n=1 Tax=Marinomonas TaxID=28253 RepID=UPI00105486F6|nr:hypothetical protein [Marinomonas sp. KMM3893]